MLFLSLACYPMLRNHFSFQSESMNLKLVASFPSFVESLPT